MLEIKVETLKNNKFMNLLVHLKMTIRSPAIACQHREHVYEKQLCFQKQKLVMSSIVLHFLQNSIMFDLTEYS